MGQTIEINGKEFPVSAIYFDDEGLAYKVSTRPETLLGPFYEVGKDQIIQEPINIKLKTKQET